ncbi:hypothetical protein BX600DRAFT_491920 [Xylariales sp. PMI_506]|nr:hypothetical protein BX600DRAFT_491920 [Xylariales sp. PMI_506]
MAHPNQQRLPLSPWADRFYPSSDPYWRNILGQAHSSLAPEFPYLPPDGFHEDPPGDPLPQPSNTELDRLFYGERVQRELLCGLTSWQIGPVTATPYGWLPSQGRPEYTRDPRWQRFYEERISVDESSWLPFLSRWRWFDLRTDCFTSIRDPFPEMYDHNTNWWTVDNEIIWDHLSVSLELVNKVLLSLINERSTWLDAILFQVREPWSFRDDAVRDLQQERQATGQFYEPLLVAPVTSVLLAESASNLMQKLIGFNERTMFGFFDEAGTYDEFKAYGITIALDMPVGIDVPESQRYTLVLIHVGFLRALCDRDTTLSERINMQIGLAITIAHEIMHATWFGRERSQGWQIPMVEPYIFPDIGCELGAAFESHTFGGVLSEVPIARDKSNFKGVSTHMNMGVWPRWWERGDLPQRVIDDALELPDLCYNYAVPVYWLSAMQDASFWQTIVSRHGSAVFKVPRILRSVVTNDWETLNGRYFGARRMRIQENTLDALRNGYSKVLNYWNARRSWWHYRRPWFNDEYRRWALTPWSWTQAREMIGKFRDAHAKRDLKECLTQAREILQLERSYHDTKDNAADNPIVWVFVAIGTMMLASIPILEEDIVTSGTAKQSELFPNSWAVSPHAPQEMQPLVVQVRHTRMLQPPHRTLRSAWSHPKDKINDFATIFFLGAQKHPLPRAWLQAVMDAGRSLWDRHHLSSRPDEWLPFEFDIPLYDVEWAIAAQSSYLHNLLPIYDIISQGQGPTSAAGRFVSPPGSPYGLPIDLLPDSTVSPGYFYKTRWRSNRNHISDHRNQTQPLTKYYTISEVGNYIADENHTWVVEPDGEYGLDVFDITEACRALGYCTAEKICDEMLTIGPSGPMLRVKQCRNAAQIRAQFRKSILPIGKVLMERKIHEIAEYNGTNGMPTWITIGPEVFDLTGFHAIDAQEWQSLTQNPGGTPEALPPLTSSLYNELITRLRPYRCALVASSTRKATRHVLYPFTHDMLKWHDNPSAGCYTAIDNIVYDISVHSRPCGRNTLMECLGGEATKFSNYHTQDVLKAYPDFPIGRLVREVQDCEIQGNEIAIHGWVFDISGLALENSNDRIKDDLYQRICKHAGTDASSSITAAGIDADALVELYLNEKERIVGKLLTEADSVENRHIPNQEVLKHNDPRNARGAWVVVGNLVYDVTHIMRYGRTFYEHEIPHCFAGKALQDETLASWLTKSQSHRAIGLMVSGAAWGEPTIEELLASLIPSRASWTRRRHCMPQRLALEYPRNSETGVAADTESPVVDLAGPRQQSRKRRASTDADKDVVRKTPSKGTGMYWRRKC